jgi:hypothetical protein
MRAILFGQGNRRHLYALPGGELSQPRVEAVRLFHPLLQHGMSTLDGELAQISVPAPAGVSQCLLPTGRMLSGHHASPGSKPLALLPLAGLS